MLTCPLQPQNHRETKYTELASCFSVRSVFLRIASIDRSVRPQRWKFFPDSCSSAVSEEPSVARSLTCPLRVAPSIHPIGSCLRCRERFQTRLRATDARTPVRLLGSSLVWRRQVVERPPRWSRWRDVHRGVAGESDLFWAALSHGAVLAPRACAAGNRDVVEGAELLG